MCKTKHDRILSLGVSAHLIGLHFRLIGEPEVQRLKTLARSLPAQGGRVLHVPAQRQRPARDAFLSMSWQEVRIQPPVNGAVVSKTEVKAWVIRV